MSEQIYISQQDGSLQQVDRLPSRLEAELVVDSSIIGLYDNYVYTIVEKTVIKNNDIEISSTDKIFRTYSDEAAAIDMCRIFNYGLNGEGYFIREFNTEYECIITTKTYTYIKNEFFGEVLEREQSWH